MTNNVSLLAFPGETNTNAHLSYIRSNVDHLTKVHLGEKCEFMEPLTHPGNKLLQEYG